MATEAEHYRELAEARLQVRRSEIGARVRRLRGARSQMDIAVAMFFSDTGPWDQTKLSKVESGTRDLRILEAISLAGALGVSVGELVGEPNDSAARELRSLRDDIDRRIATLTEPED